MAKMEVLPAQVGILVEAFQRLHRRQVLTERQLAAVSRDAAALPEALWQVYVRETEAYLRAEEAREEEGR